MIAAAASPAVAAVDAAQQPAQQAQLQVQREPFNAQVAIAQKKVTQFCVTDDLGYTPSPKDCVNAQQMLYVAKAKSSPNFKGFIHAGVVKVHVDATDVLWGQSRNIAYRSAIHEARVSLLSELDMNIRTRQEKRKIEDRDPQFSSEEKSAYRDKQASLKVATSVADAVIEGETGQAPDLKSVDLQPLEKSQFVGGEEFGTRTQINAAAEISGAYVVKTFEATSAQGETWVSAVIRGSVNSKRAVKAIYEGGAAYQAVPGKAARGIDIDEWFLQHYDTMFANIGTKLVWDKAGYPVLLSFGQAFNVKQPNSASYDRYESSIMPSLARNDALSHLSQIFNLQGSLDAESYVGQLSGKKLTITYDGKTETQIQEDVSETIATLDELSKMASSVVGISGLKEVGQFENIHPVTQKKIVGKVYAWSPKYAGDALAYTAEQAADTSRAMGGVNPVSTSNRMSGTNRSFVQSADLMDNSDF